MQAKRSSRPKVNRIVAEFVTSFPKELEPGVLYVSAPFSTATHLCACGCGREVITPLSPEQWVITFDGSVSMRPSIGNWAYPCQSHYLIQRGSIQWARSFTREEARRNRDSDHRALDQANRARNGRWMRILQRFGIR